MNKKFVGVLVDTQNGDYGAEHFEIADGVITLFNENWLPTLHLPLNIVNEIVPQYKEVEVDTSDADGDDIGSTERDYCP